MNPQYRAPVTDLHTLRLALQSGQASAVLDLALPLESALALSLQKQ